jgi:hypothetical protein
MTMFEYYLPGLDYTKLSARQFALKYAQLEHIRKRESIL